MKITLIDPSNYTINVGLRIISAHLRKNGFETDLIFLPTFKEFGSKNVYSKQVIDKLLELIKNSQLVGISLLSNYFFQGVELTKIIKKHYNIPVIWGGVHPTAKPEECLNHADAVCLGEGEDAILEFAKAINTRDKKQYYKVKNLWIKKGRKIIKNDVRPIEQDIDKYPLQDYSFENHYVSTGAELVPLTKEEFLNRPEAMSEADRTRIQYYIMCSRGCPHSCTYCCNNLYKKLYLNKGCYLRRRSVANIIKELRTIKKQLNPGFVNIFDDSFIATTDEEIEKFAKAYKKYINLPFKCNFSARAITARKMIALVKIGLTEIELGIQTGSEKVNKEIYKRYVSNEATIRAANIINKYGGGLIPHYDIILDNPYETTEDLIETIKLLLKLPKPFKISYFSLTFFPGTEIYEKAKNDGIISDEESQVYKKANNALYYDQNVYLKLLLSMTTTSFSRFVDVLVRKEFVRIFNRKIFNALFQQVFTIGLKIKGKL